MCSLFSSYGLCQIMKVGIGYCLYYIRMGGREKNNSFKKYPFINVTYQMHVFSTFHLEVFFSTW